MNKVVKVINDVTYEFIDEIDVLYNIKRECQINKYEDDIFYCYLKNNIKKLSMLDSGFVCSKKEFCSCDIVEYHNTETTVVFLKKITIKEYIEGILQEKNIIF